MYISGWVSRLRDRPRSLGQMLVILRDVKWTGKFCNRFIFNLCKCIPPIFRLIVMGKEGESGALGCWSTRSVSLPYPLVVLDYPPTQ